MNTFIKTRVFQDYLLEMADKEEFGKRAFRKKNNNFADSQAKE